MRVERPAPTDARDIQKFFFGVMVIPGENDFLDDVVEFDHVDVNGHPAVALDRGGDLDSTRCEPVSGQQFANVFLDDSFFVWPAGAGAHLTENVLFRVDAVVHRNHFGDDLAVGRIAGRHAPRPRAIWRSTHRPTGRNFPADKRHDKPLAPGDSAQSAGLIPAGGKRFKSDGGNVILAKRERGECCYRSLHFGFCKFLILVLLAKSSPVW